MFDHKSVAVEESVDGTGVEVTIAKGSWLEFYVYCEDGEYNFKEPRRLHLGEFLSRLGLDAEACEAALREWEGRRNEPRA